MGLIAYISFGFPRISTKVEIVWVLLRGVPTDQSAIYKSRNCVGLIALLDSVLAVLIYKSRNCVGLIASGDENVQRVSTKVEIVWVLLRRMETIKHTNLQK